MTIADPRARALALLFRVEDVGRLGETRIAEVQLAADVVREDGVEHRLVKLPVVANLDRADHVEPEVERTFVRFEAARARGVRERHVVARHGFRNALVPVVTVLGLQVAMLLGDPAFKAGVVNRIPLGRVGDTHDLTGAVVFLLSDASGFITGQTLIADGGVTVGG